MADTTYLVGWMIYFYLVKWSNAQLAVCGERYRVATNVFKNLTFHHNSTDWLSGDICTWTIQAENDSSFVHTEVTNTKLNIFSISCSRYTSNITVYDGPDASGEPLLRWCKKDTPIVTSSGRHLTFQLSANFFVAKGSVFSLRYKQERFQEMCNGTLSAFSNDRVFTSPGYPKGLPRNQRCGITITTTSSHALNLTAIDVDVGSACIHIYDGIIQTSHHLATLCGTEVSTLSSTGDRMLVEFSTDDNPTRRGFKMKYHSISSIYVCPSRRMTANIYQTEITSPFYPNNYPHNADCTWVIQGYNAQTVVHIQMIDFELEASRDCTADYLEIYDVYASLSSTKKLCGNSLPPDWASTGRTVTISFHSDGRVAKSGFRLLFSSRHKTILSPEPPTVNVGLMVGCIVGITICISCICCCFACRTRKTRLARQGRHLSPPQTHQTFPAGNPQSQQSAQTPDRGRPGQQQTVYTIGGDTPAIPPNFLPPPSYDEVIAKDAMGGTGPSPPSYGTLIASSDTHPRKSSPINESTAGGGTDVQTQL